MKLESQVCNLELAKRLKELGVAQKSVFFWVWENGDIVKPKIYFVEELREFVEDKASAFTVAELGEMLPHWIVYQKCAAGWLAEEGMGRVHFDKPTEADARAKMLIYLLENKLMEVPS